MIRLRGKRKGEKLTPVQFANDWISADTLDGGHEILSPGSVRLEPEDFAMFTDTDPQRVGTFWREWRLDRDGRFRRNKSMVARNHTQAAGTPGHDAPAQPTQERTLS